MVLNSPLGEVEKKMKNGTMLCKYPRKSCRKLKIGKIKRVNPVEGIKTIYDR